MDRHVSLNDWHIARPYKFNPQFSLYVSGLDRWITNDANMVRFPQLLLIPCLFFTLMVGPTGLLAYFLVKNLLGYTVTAKTD